jgi:hypothetical protein
VSDRGCRWFWFALEIREGVHISRMDRDQIGEGVVADDKNSRVFVCTPVLCVGGCLCHGQASDLARHGYTARVQGSLRSVGTLFGDTSCPVG